MVIRSRTVPDGESGGRVPPMVRGLLVVGLLYLFLTGVGLLSEGIGLLGRDVQEALFQRVRTPVAGLFVGVLATVLVQSSSVTTSAIVSLVGAGVVGVEQAVPMVMGANIGTTVTSTLASVGSIRRPVEFERALGAATVHDMYNLLSVAALLPLELLTGVLARTAAFISSLLVGSEGTTFRSPLKAIVEAPADLVASLVGRITSGTAMGVVMIVLALVAIFFALGFVTLNMKAMAAGSMEHRINRVLGEGRGMVAMGVGLLVTVTVQSSTITTSVLVPVAAAGVISLPAVYPVTVGANIGTTTTALLASMASTRPEAVTIALVHLIYNLASALIWYAIPALRPVPVRMARWMASVAAADRRLLPTYVLGTFVVLPLLGILLLG